MFATRFAALGVADAVFGPTEDGGYWLIALGPRRPADLFGAARWSTEHALADTLRQFGQTPRGLHPAAIRMWIRRADYRGILEDRARRRPWPPGFMAGSEGSHHGPRVIVCDRV